MLLSHLFKIFFFCLATLERLEIELTFAMISIFDQQIDFIVILSYTLYWASEMNFAPVNREY